MTNKILTILVVFVLLVGSSSCMWTDIKAVGVFKNPVKYQSEKKNTSEVAYIKMSDGTKIRFHYLGKCGGGATLFSLVIPMFIPIYFKTNSCEQDGLYIKSKLSPDTKGVAFQLHYNNKTLSPYLDGDQIKFKIPNFSEFKSSTDKTLIIKKGKLAKELPFEWKVKIETVVVP